MRAMRAKPWLIVEGDEVVVNWADTSTITGVVRNVPMADGESWIIEQASGMVHYVQRFESMVRMKKGEE